jgi:hypothetical protein
MKAIESLHLAGIVGRQDRSVLVSAALVFRFSQRLCGASVAQSSASKRTAISLARAASASREFLSVESTLPEVPESAASTIKRTIEAAIDSVDVFVG